MLWIMDMPLEGKTSTRRLNYKDYIINLEVVYVKDNQGNQ
jgi:hypothetical protein